jgi:hypothetical protein
MCPYGYEVKSQEVGSQLDLEGLKDIGLFNKIYPQCTDLCAIITLQYGDYNDTSSEINFAWTDNSVDHELDGRNRRFFILVGCILLRNVYIALLNINLQSQLRVL